MGSDLLQDPKVDTSLAISRARLHAGSRIMEALLVGGTILVHRPPAHEELQRVITTIKAATVSVATSAADIGAAIEAL